MAFHRRTTLYHIFSVARPDGEPDGRDEKKQIAEDGGERAGGRNTAEAAAGDVEAAQGGLEEGDDEHDEHCGNRGGGETHPAGEDQERTDDALGKRNGDREKGKREVGKHLVARKKTGEGGDIAELHRPRVGEESAKAHAADAFKAASDGETPAPLPDEKCRADADERRENSPDNVLAERRTAPFCGWRRNDHAGNGHGQDRTPGIVACDLDRLGERAYLLRSERDGKHRRTVRRNLHRRQLGLRPAARLDAGNRHRCVSFVAQLDSSDGIRADCHLANRHSLWRHSQSRRGKSHRRNENQKATQATRDSILNPMRQMVGRDRRARRNEAPTQHHRRIIADGSGSRPYRADLLP